MSQPSAELSYDRYLVDQLIRPIANLYRITPLAGGETPAGPPIAFVRQRKLAIKEDIRFYGDEAETQEIFRIAARTMFDTGGSRYDVVAGGGERIGVLHHLFKSIIRTTWSVQDANEQEIAVARERSQFGAIARRLIDFVPDVGGMIPIPYNLSGDTEKRIDRRLAIALAVGLDTLQNR